MQKHPDFEFELQRLDYTKHYMQKLLLESMRDVQSSQDEIRHAMADLDYLDSSLSYINILTNTRFFEMARTQKEGLEAIQEKPYFARIHFKADGEKDEFLYIGKTSVFHQETQEPIIVDWRSPVANVYYDGRLGDLTYKVRDEEVSGHLFSKRQYKIEKGELLDILDVDLTTNDELLQEALAGKADVRLTEIVSTIQAEQNEIIRANLRQPIIVQGAAGSGKTTIALHRISYFLYTMGADFPSEKLMILAPSKLFMEYIGDVLPELGVGRICQTTFTEYVLNATGLKLKLADPNGKLEMLTAGTFVNEETLFIAKMKGTLEYREIMQQYVKKLEHETAELFEDIYIEKYRIIRAARLKKLFLEDFNYMPLEKRIERIRVIVQSEVNRKRKQLYKILSDKYEEALDKALYGIRDDEKRRSRITRIMDERDERLPSIEKEGKQKVASYMRRFKKFNCKKLYRDWLTDPQLHKELACHWSDSERDAFFAAHVIDLWETEDLAALYYLHAKLKGIEDKWKMRVVFIDEVQDYSEFQLAALQDGLETDMFTMVGDLAQGIHSYRALTSWDPVQQMFPRATYTTLQKSYRTTIEIMELANKVLAQMDEDLPLVEPVVRHGRDPEFYRMNSLDTSKVNEIYQAILQRGHRSIALICKTRKEAAAIHKQLEQSGMPVQLLGENSDINGDCLLIVPSHLSKGLEFDAVIIAAYEEPFRDHPIDRKLLYVAMTRPMHELHLISDSLIPLISPKNA
ncbi:RNA polymerase recycling motor HelD [Sporosarcina highlanderae]|uniref:RNA polymerase recycling motor HelD n=1 Tax=Sporosarcina highlanderae TaxID=3035916 RepID=A0ABT8JQ19_9BACL|nr:RNA polymerase recycling motor HelD [Sporosarcina highlanderae]MDN4606898.1 RNA polymerase recycling motor HelD [Sporosarcina highlanderae]